MFRNICLLVITCAAFAAGDAWDKVRQLKSGTELRIYKSGVKQPIEAKFDEATDENLIVATKSEQLAIPRDAIERIDSRGPQTSSRVKTESKTEWTPERPVNTPQERAAGASGPSRSVSSNVSFEGKPGFETIYRRTAPAKKQE